MMVSATISNYGLLGLWLGRRLGLSDLASGSGIDVLGLGIGSLALDWQHGLQVWQWLGQRLGALETGKIAYPSECVRICPAR